MVFARTVLLLTAMALVVIGVGFLWTPVSWAAAIDVVVSTPMGRTDVRATYGGFVLMSGIFLAICAFRPEWLHAGLTACALILGGFALGRVVGLVVEGSLSTLMWTFLVIEVVGTGASLGALRRLGPSPSSGDRQRRRG
jgi:hypothetical protein